MAESGVSLRTLATRGRTSCRRRTWFRAPAYNSADCSARGLSGHRAGYFTNTWPPAASRVLAAAPRGDRILAFFVGSPARSPTHPRWRPVFVDGTRQKPDSSTLKACFCGWNPPEDRLIHAGGRFLWMASLTLAYSFRFISMLFGAILERAHRRHPPNALR